MHGLRINSWKREIDCINGGINDRMSAPCRDLSGETKMNSITDARYAPNARDPKGETPEPKLDQRRGEFEQQMKILGREDAVLHNEMRTLNKEESLVDQSELQRQGHGNDQNNGRLSGEKMKLFNEEMGTLNKEMNVLNQELKLVDHSKPDRRNHHSRSFGEKMKIFNDEIKDLNKEMSVLNKELRLVGHHGRSPDEKMKILNEQMSTLNEELNVLNEELAALDRKHVNL